MAQSEPLSPLSDLQISIDNAPLRSISHLSPMPICRDYVELQEGIRYVKSIEITVVIYEMCAWSMHITRSYMQMYMCKYMCIQYIHI